ncbi:DinB family protein [Actinomadura oligospora]|uniref:DinB family protein n=1 Tax=Actinomadura oligospora TaxID=111804 RepID=UPI0007E8B928|nr:DinB family protein [Actinomadura oligospora]
MTSAPESLIGLFDRAWTRTAARLAGLTDAEYLWEPVPDGWTIRPDESGRWRIDADGGGPAPDPVPVPTIAWRMGHVGLTFVDFGERLFNGRNITIDDVEFSGTADGGVAFLENAYRRHWREPLEKLTAEEWWCPGGPAFFGFAERPVFEVVLHVLDEFVHHTAEIGVLRDLYGKIAPVG